MDVGTKHARTLTSAPARRLSSLLVLLFYFSFFFLLLLPLLLSLTSDHFCLSPVLRKRPSTPATGENEERIKVVTVCGLGPHIRATILSPSLVIP